MNRKSLIILSIGLFLANLAFAQFNISGDIRPRGEIRNGYKQLPDTLNLPAFFISQRSRLIVSVKKEKYKALMSIQDVRIWGDELNYSSTGIHGDNASIDLKEAWIEAYINAHFSIKVGRQEFKYGDQRLLADRNWNQHGLSYDALKFSYHDALKIDIGFSYGNDKELVFNELYSVDKLKTLNFIYFEKNFMEKFNVLGLYILSGTQHPDKPNGMNLKNTAGAAITYTLNDLKVSGSGYYQFGRNKSGLQVSSYLWNCNAQYSLNKMGLLAGIDYLSGHNYASGDSVYLKIDHTFDLLYGARHRYYGAMDYFSNVGKSTADGGLIDYYAQFDYNIIDGFSFIFTYHRFQLQNNVTDPDSPSEIKQLLEKHLANELDTKLSWKINNDILLDLGYSFLRSYDSLNKIQGNSTDEAKNAHWFWLMCTFKPVFFSTE